MWTPMERGVPAARAYNLTGRFRLVDLCPSIRNGTFHGPRSGYLH